MRLVSFFRKVVKLRVYLEGVRLCRLPLLFLFGCCCLVDDYFTSFCEGDGKRVAERFIEASLPPGGKVAVVDGPFQPFGGDSGIAGKREDGYLLSGKAG